MRTNKLRTMLVYLCVCAQLLVVGATRAQNGRGTVSGRVTDTSGGVLQGAAVELDPAGLTRGSDAQGEFTFTGVAAGKATNSDKLFGVGAPFAADGGETGGKGGAKRAAARRLDETGRNETAGERPTIAFSGTGGLTPIAGTRRAVEATGTLGQRFGSQKRFGALIGGSYDWNGRGIDDLEPVPDQAMNLPGSPTQYEAIDIREYRYYRTRWGIAGSLDYKPSDGSTLYVHGLYSDFKNYGERWVYSLNDNTTGVQLLGANGCGTDANEVTIQPA